MKTEEEIKSEITRLMFLIVKLNKEYSVMHQIDMQSQEGNKNRENTNKAIGKIEALRWVLI